MEVEVRLYATLRQWAPVEAARGVFAVSLPEGSRVADLIALVCIPAAEVHMIMVNGIAKEPDTLLRAADRIGLFPPVGGG